MTFGGEDRFDLPVTVGGRFRDRDLERAVNLFAWYVERGMLDQAETAAADAFNVAEATRREQVP
jgi:hypothetical protein